MSPKTPSAYRWNRATRSRMIFDSIYGKGGEKEVSDADLKAYYAENYQHIQYISISTKDLEGDDLQKRKDLANEMIGRAVMGRTLFLC